MTQNKIVLYLQPPEGLVPSGGFLFPYQIEDIKKICGPLKNRSVFLGHQMGLGKCVIAIMSWKLMKHRRILVICPAAVRGVWEYEIKKWAPRATFQSISSGKEKLRTDVNVTITSYDLAIDPNIAKQILGSRWDAMTVDECHSLGNPRSKRTKIILGNFYPKIPRTYFLSGSIHRDKINQVWPIFRTLSPEKIPPYKEFLRQYCRTKERDWGVQILGGKNLKQLGRIAKDFMLRRKKEDVLKDLPEKLEQVIYVELKEEDKERFVSSSLSYKTKIVQTIKQNKRLDGELSKLCLELGLKKLPLIVEQVLGHLETKTHDGFKRLVVFVRHRTVFYKLLNDLSCHARVVGFCGETPEKKRQEAIEQFQANKADIFLATYAAAEGITLTAANCVLIGEMSWSLATNEQAIDRLHRISQKNTVYVKYILAKDSLDEIVYNVYKRKLNEKQKAFDSGDKQSERKSFNQLTFSEFTC